MDALKLLPPTIWCRWGEGTWPGLTSGSTRSMTSCEQLKRIMGKEDWAVAREAAAARRRRCILVVVMVLGEGDCDGMERGQPGRESWDTKHGGSAGTYQGRETSCCGSTAVKTGLTTLMSSEKWFILGDLGGAREL